MNKLKQGINIIRCKAGMEPSHPLKMQVLLSYSCNSNCYFCARNGRGGPSIDFKTIKRAVKDFKNLGGLAVNFSGGEPLLYNKIESILKYSKQKIKLDKVSVSTNGLILEKKIEKLSKHLDKVYISLDTLDEKKYKKIRGVDGLKKVLRGIDKTKKMNIPVIINITLTKDNMEELEDLLNFGKEKNLEVGIQPVHDLEGGDFSNPTEISMDALKKAIKKISKYKNILHQSMDYIQKFPAFLKSPEKLFKKYRCYAGSLLLNIDPYGNVYPCDAKFTKMGNIYKKNLKQIWKSSQRKNICENIKKGKHPKCWLNCIAPLNVKMKDSSLLELIKKGKDYSS